ncbi:MAG: hypothetical protein ACR2O1_05540, partial [Boseongicola sp.]
LTKLRERRTRARVRIWTLAEFLENPAQPLQVIVDDLSVPGSQTLVKPPKLQPMHGMAEFLQKLRNTGMNPHTAGAFSEQQVTQASKGTSPNHGAQLSS